MLQNYLNNSPHLASTRVEHLLALLAVYYCQVWPLQLPERVAMTMSMQLLLNLVYVH